MECLRESVVHCVFNLQPYLSSDHPPLPPTTVSSWTSVGGNHKDSWKCPGLDTEEEVQTKSMQSRLIWPCDIARSLSERDTSHVRLWSCLSRRQILAISTDTRIGSIFTVTVLLCSLYFLLPCPSTLTKRRPQCFTFARRLPHKSTTENPGMIFTPK